MTDSTLDPPRSRGSHKPWAYDPPYPVAHYALGPGSNTLQAQHSHQGLLAAGQKQIWALWHIPPTGRHGPPLFSHSDVMVLEEVTPLPNPLCTWRPVWIQLSESNRSSTLLTPIWSLMDKLAIQWTASWPLHVLELTGDLLLFIP